MERQLKERMVGATVLVAAVIIVVPQFLDGPAHRNGADGSRVSQPLNLPAAGVDNRSHVIQLDAPAPTPTVPRRAPSKPQPAPSDPPTDKRTAAPTDATARETSRAQRPAPVAAAPRPVAVDPASGWVVQVGAFSKESNARRLADELRKSKYSAFVVRNMVDGSVRYRVRVGPEQDRARAELLESRLKADGQSTRIVPHP